VPDLFALEDMQAAICPILNFDQAAIERSNLDPGAKRFWAWVEGRAKQSGAVKGAAAAPEDDDLACQVPQRRAVARSTNRAGSCDAVMGHRGEETPRRFTLDDQLVEILAVVDQWRTPEKPDSVDGVTEAEQFWRCQWRRATRTTNTTRLAKEGWLRGRDWNPRPLGYESRLTSLPGTARRRASRFCWGF
jgi:hypothetical protein